MASKRTLNAKNLEALGAAALAELLIEVSGGNAVIQRRLRLALAAGEGTDRWPRPPSWSLKPWRSMPPSCWRRTPMSSSIHWCQR